MILQHPPTRVVQVIDGDDSIGDGLVGGAVVYQPLDPHVHLERMRASE